MLGTKDTLSLLSLVPFWMLVMEKQVINKDL